MITNRDGVTQFVVALFMKLRPQPGQRAPKGEEMRVTLETDPGEGFEEGSGWSWSTPGVDLSARHPETGARAVGGLVQGHRADPGRRPRARHARHAGGGEK